MSCARSSSRAGVRDPSSGLGSSPSTCSSSTYSSSTYSLNGEVGKGSRISGGWIEKSIGESGTITGGSGVATEGICASSGKRSKTEEEDREA